MRGLITYLEVVSLPLFGGKLTIFDYLRACLITPDPSLPVNVKLWWLSQVEELSPQVANHFSLSSRPSDAPRRERSFGALVCPQTLLLSPVTDELDRNYI